MKKTKTVLVARIFIVLALMLFLFTVITQNTVSNFYVNGLLYLFAILSFGIGAVLAFVAACKDKEHLKSVELAKKDERLNNITMRSKAKAFDIILFILPLVTSYFVLNKLIDTTAMIILGMLCLILLIIQIYYFLRYSKEM